MTTTPTITPEERKYLTILHRLLRSGARPRLDPAWTLQALDALEAAEARAVEAERQRDWLAEYCRFGNRVYKSSEEWLEEAASQVTRKARQKDGDV